MKTNLLFSLILLINISAFSQVYTFATTEDVSLGYHDGYGTAANNFGNDTYFRAFCVPGAAGWGANSNRSLIYFNISSLPAGSKIISAKLYLTAGAYFNTLLPGHFGNNSAVVQRVTSAWTEGTANWNNQPSTTIIGQGLVAPSGSLYQNYAVDVTDIVKYHQSIPSQNYGMMLRLTNEDPNSSSALGFCSSDAVDVNKHPKLIIQIANCSINKDSIVTDYDVALGYHDNQNTSSNNYGSASQNAAFCIPGVSGGVNSNRALMHFNLSPYTDSSLVLSAKLNLFAGPAGNISGHLGTNNVSLIQRVLSSWQENNATWDNQPTATVNNQVTLPASVDPLQDYTGIDVTQLVKDMIANPSSNHGFLLKLLNEIPSNAISFKSKDASGGTKAPTLEIFTKTKKVDILTTQKSICLGESLTISSSSASGNYTWSTGQTTQSITVSPIINTTYIVSDSSNSCKVVDSLTITVNTLPTPIATINGSSTFCAGSTSLSSNYSNGNQWFINGNLLSTETNQNMYPNQSGFYTVKVTDVNGCVATSGIVSATVKPAPTIDLSCTEVKSNYNSKLLGTCTYCEDVPIKISAFANGTYAWSNNTTDSVLLISPTVGTSTYTLTVTSSNGCTASASQTITVNPKPTKPTILVNSGVLASSSANGNQWYRNGTLISGETNQFYTTTQGGNYSVTVTNGFGCSVNSDNVAVTTINNYKDAVDIDIYPNPSNGNFELKLEIVNAGEFNISISNILGQILNEQKLNLSSGKNSLPIHVNSLNKGNYIFKLFNKNGSITKRLTIY